MSRHACANAQGCAIALLIALGGGLSTHGCLGRLAPLSVEDIAISPTSTTLNTNAAAATIKADGEDGKPLPLKQLHTIFGRDRTGWPAESAQVEVNATALGDTPCPIRLAAVENGNCMVLADTKMLCTLGVDGRAQFEAVANMSTDGVYSLGEAQILLKKARNANENFSVNSSPTATISVTAAGLDSATTVEIESTSDHSPTIQLTEMNGSGWTDGPCNVVLSGRDCSSFGPSRKTEVWLNLSQRPSAVLYAKLSIVPDITRSVWFASENCLTPTSARTASEVSFPANATNSSSVLLCTDGSKADVTINASILGAREDLIGTLPVRIQGLVATLATVVTDTAEPALKQLSLALRDCSGNSLDSSVIGRVEAASPGVVVNQVAGLDNSSSRYSVALPSASVATTKSTLRVTFITGQTCTLEIGGES